MNCIFFKNNLSKSYKGLESTQQSSYSLVLISLLYKEGLSFPLCMFFVQIYKKQFKKQKQRNYLVSLLNLYKPRIINPNPPINKIGLSGIVYGVKLNDTPIIPIPNIAINISTIALNSAFHISVLFLYK